MWIFTLITSSGHADPMLSRAKRAVARPPAAVQKTIISKSLMIGEEGEYCIPYCGSIEAP